MASLTPTQERIITFLFAGAGCVVFMALNMPLPILLGPMVACLLAALLRAPLRDSGSLAVFMRTFLGVAVGTAITPALLHDLPDYAASLVFMPLFILLIGAAGYPLLRYGFKFDHATAYYGAMPGGLQDMLIFGEEAGGNPRILSLIHATRVLVIVVIAPFLLSFFWDADLTKAPGASASSVPVQELCLMLLSGYLGWKTAARLGLFGAPILGPMILSALLTLSGLISNRPPAEIIWAAQFFIGVSLGSKYIGVTLTELRSVVMAGLVYSLLLGVISVVFIFIVLAVSGSPSLEVFLSYLPGGQSEMMVIALMAGADIAFVVSHHLLRIVIVITLSPLVLMVLKRIR